MLYFGARTLKSRLFRRHGQVVKAEVCKTFIPGSSPGGASKCAFVRSVWHISARAEKFIPGDHKRRPMVSMVAQRSPKPLVGVQILLGLPSINSFYEKIYFDCGVTCGFFICGFC